MIGLRPSVVRGTHCWSWNLGPTGKRDRRTFGTRPRERGGDTGRG